RDRSPAPRSGRGSRTASGCGRRLPSCILLLHLVLPDPAPDDLPNQRRRDLATLRDAERAPDDGLRGEFLREGFPVLRAQPEEAAVAPERGEVRQAAILAVVGHLVADRLARLRRGLPDDPPQFPERAPGPLRRLRDVVGDGRNVSLHGGTSRGRWRGAGASPRLRPTGPAALSR